ncbi:MAG: S9 family peptidase [Candidatus Delongbacteria bacterium]|jgi:dipeptidyl aminopeptidase/acylaminoacyl peptidase|nr:S9 family peptidase [Candidatus Delongbacteria bacterium]
MKQYVNVMLVLSLAFIFSCDAGQQQQTDESPLEIDNSLTEEEIENGILTPEVLWKFNRIGSAHLSPDANTVVFTMTKYSVEENTGLTHIYSISTEGGEPQQLTSGESSCHSPQWIQDGKSIAYLSADTSGTQLWVMDADGANKEIRSQIEGGINYFSVVPYGEKILYCKDVKMNDTPIDKYPDLPEANVHIATDLMYRHWNHWDDGTRSHIFVAEFGEDLIETGKDILEGENYDAPLSPYFDYSDIAWSPDAKKIAYVCKKLNGVEYSVSTNSDVYLYDCESGNTENLSAPNPGYDLHPVFSNDGSKLAWEQMKQPRYESDRARLVVYDFETGTLTSHTEKFDESVSSINWSDDDKKIYFISGTEATYQVFRISLDSGLITQLTQGPHNYSGLELEGETMLAHKTAMDMAKELFMLNKEGSAKQLTEVNKHIYDHIEMGNVRKEWVETTDGKQMLVWEILPPGFDETKTYPAILYCQGGPQSAVSQFFSYRWNFQIMAANGYVVIAPNRRGLPTFGSEWNEQISGDYPGQNMKDYFSAVDAFKTKDYIDEDNIGAVGASYGGFSVYWLAGHHDGRFSAFISHCGMFNLESMYNATEEYWFVNKDLGGAYWKKNNPVAQRTYAQSPHKFVDKWDTPIMMITGEYDFRIPYTESVQAFNAARLNDVPAKLLVFPEESHFVLQPQNAILWQREFKAWLDKWLKDSE